MDNYQRNELHGLKDLVVRLAEVTEGGLKGAIIDLGPEDLAKTRINLMNKDYSQFDRLFMAVCSDFSSEVICLTEEAGKFPDHRFVLFENDLWGIKREELHYVLGSSADSVEKY